MQPIKKLLKKDEPQVWGEEQELALQRGIAELKSTVLVIPDFRLISVDNPFLIDSDASTVAGGGTLGMIVDGKEKLISCYSFSFTKSQLSWPIIRKELYSLLRCHGEDVYNDAYTRLSAGFDAYPIVAHEYRPGKKHLNADIMTRDTDKALDRGKNVLCS
uniref:Reverse transcriptase/retrotransposon-derived protein RNase H-like domain-containing protein n=1 Tax=Lotharella globosa TaxID=91324 RepID=A0A7S3Z260_9EUKA